MPYAPTQKQLIEDFQLYLSSDPHLWDQPSGALTWWGRVVLFEQDDEEITLEVDGESISFPRP